MVVVLFGVGQQFLFGAVLWYGRFGSASGGFVVEGKPL